MADLLSAGQPCIEAFSRFPWKSVSTFDPFILFVQCHPIRRVEIEGTDLLLFITRRICTLFLPASASPKVNKHFISSSKTLHLANQKVTQIPSFAMSCDLLSRHEISTILSFWRLPVWHAIIKYLFQLSADCKF